jgi:hypothetical protein
MDLNESLKSWLMEQFSPGGPVDKVGLGLSHAAGTIGQDAAQGAAILNDPRNSWIGMNPLGRVGTEGLMGLSMLLGALRGQSSRIAIRPGELDPQRFMTVKQGGKGYEAEAFPQAFDLQVAHPKQDMGLSLEQLQAWAKEQGIDPSIFDQTFLDGIKGLNSGHALRRAADNWPDAEEIRIVGKKGLGLTP